jgi:hypothetical protein
MPTNIAELKSPSDDVGLWRYMNVDRFLALLQTSELYFAGKTFPAHARCALRS